MSEFTEAIEVLFKRDLMKLQEELNLYEYEDDMWKIQGEIKNSGGNLALHLIGNLRHFFGHVLGKLDYIRDREHEFGAKNGDRNEMIGEIDVTIDEVTNVLRGLSNDQLQEVFPINVLGYEMTTAHFITHLYGHLNYHLGQINYHRRVTI